MLNRASTLNCILAITCLSLYGQLNRGSLTGTITDPTGATIPDARITIKNSGTNAIYETRANAVGQYTMPNLPVGGYEVTFEAVAFKKLVHTGITLGVTEVARVDAVLQVGSVTESVEVTAEAQRLQADTPMTGASLTNRDLIELPMSWGSEGRVVEYFVYKIMPGATGDPWTSHVNGSTAFSKETLLDGVTVTTYNAGHFEEGSVSTEAIQDFKVQTSGMGAEFGRMQAGVYNYAMKSGTNIYHGSLYGSLRNEALDANTFVNNFRGIGRTLDRRQNYAFSFGGPITVPKVYHGRDKTFFYTAYERYRERTGGMAAPNITLPLPDYLQGDFSRLLGAGIGQSDSLGNPVYKGEIYDPATFSQLANGTWTGQMFPGNKIPVNRFSQVSQRFNDILKQYYTPIVRDSSGQIPLLNNASLPVSQQPQFDYYMFSIKGDQIINDKHHMSGSYSHAARPRLQISSSYVWSPQDTASGASGGPLAGSRMQRVATDLARIADDYTISPHLLNFFSVYYNRQVLPGVGTSADIDGAANLGMKGMTTHGYPTMNWSAGPFVPLTNAGYTALNYVANIGYGLLETVSFSRGRHFMKAGFDYRRNMLNERPTQGGGYTFSPLSTSIPGASFSGTQTGYAFASYLLGTVYSASLSDPIGAGDRRHYYGAFFQDDFKVSSTFTLNLGLRWEFQPPFREVADRLSSWNASKTDPISGLRGAYDFAGNCSACTGGHSFGQSFYHNWGPRIGFAWQPWKGWTMRGAYGIFYEGDLPQDYTGTPLGKPTQVAFGGTWALSANAVNPWAGIFNWDSGLPPTFYQAAAYNLSWGNSNQPGMVDPDYGKPSYSQQWNFNVQREVVRNLVIDIGYVGNKTTGIHNGELARVNQLSPAVLAQYGSKLNNSIKSASDAAANGVPYPYPGFSGTVAGALRPYPQVQGTQTVRLYGSPLGFSTFHSLQAVVNKQFGHGLSLYANYVWSKNLTNTSQSFVGGNGGPEDYYNLALEKSLSSYDIPHAFKAYVDYQLPFGKGKAFNSSSRAVNAVIGGWTVTAVLNYLDGAPLGRVTGSAPISSWNGAVNRGNVTPGADLLAGFDSSRFDFGNTLSSADTFINKAAFSNPAALTLGTAANAYNELRAFPTLNEDFSLLKTVHFTERVRMQLRGDFLNALNRHKFGGVSTNVTASNFGQVTSVSGNRSIQIGARLDF